VLLGLKTKELMPFLLFAAVLIALAVMVTMGFGKIERLWIIFPLSGIRISTLSALLLSFALVLWLQRKNTLKSIYFAVLGVIVPMALFEITWFYIAAAIRGWDLRILQFAALFGWVLLGFREVYKKRPPKISILLYGMFIVSMGVWIATGFNFNDLNNPTFSFSSEALNVLSKSTLIFGFAIPIGATKSSSLSR
jgi:hypothetical protein